MFNGLFLCMWTLRDVDTIFIVIAIFIFIYFVKF